MPNRSPRGSGFLGRDQQNSIFTTQNSLPTRCITNCLRLQQKQYSCPPEANMATVISKDNNNCSSGRSGGGRSSSANSSLDNFLSYLSGEIQSPSPPSSSSAPVRLNNVARIGVYNDPPPGKIEPAAVSDRPLGSSSTARPPLKAINAWDATRSAPMHQRGDEESWGGVCPPPSAPPLDLLEDDYFEETGQVPYRPTPVVVQVCEAV
jgi:hypothetical protein